MGFFLVIYVMVGGFLYPLTYPQPFTDLAACFAMMTVINHYSQTRPYFSGPDIWSGQRFKNGEPFVIPEGYELFAGCVGSPPLTERLQR